MNDFLAKIEVLDYQYRKLKERDNFNIFSILLNPFDEVKLHSRFIFELLNPKGRHGYGTLFLEKFLEILEIELMNLDGIRVFNERKKIDILIENNNKAIVIENKVWAPDQDKQLMRYYDKMEAEGKKDVWLIYLTPHGKRPSKESIGDLNKRIDIEKNLKLISYEEDIKQWIGLCLQSTFRDSKLRETLIQYENLIDYLTGNTTNMEERKELIRLISEGKNIISAKKIVDNWIHIRWHLEWEFWVDLEVQLKKSGIEIIEKDKYNNSRLNNVYHRRKKNPWYGLILDIMKINETDSLCVYIERGDGRLYYLLNAVRNRSRRDICQEEKFDRFTEIFDEDDPIQRTQYCFGGRYFSEDINFNDPNHQDTLMLMNRNQRKRVIDLICKEIYEFIDELNTKFDGG